VKRKPQKSLIRIPKEVLDELLQAGNQCSNLCYNLKQDSGTRPRDAESMGHAYQAWDHALLAMRQALNAKSSK
jgi:hypothetical protein